MIKTILFILTVLIFTSVLTTITYFVDPMYSLTYNLIINIIVSAIVLGGFIKHSSIVETQTIERMRSDGLSEEDIKKIMEV